MTSDACRGGGQNRKPRYGPLYYRFLVKNDPRKYAELLADLMLTGLV